jgi:hypothetical protein
MKNSLLFLIVSLLFFGKIIGQESFTLKNPSFEDDKPATGVVPSGWLNMGAPEESPPDIQPGQFGVTLKPQDGKRYLGLVVRDNNTWEGVGQQLDGFLKKDSTYSFSIWLARANNLISTSKLTGQETQFNDPTILKIWGLNSETRQEELLAESVPVSHSQWTLYTFTLKPTVADFDEIDLMAYYAQGYEQKNGNLLIDNCSAIAKVAAEK